MTDQERAQGMAEQRYGGALDALAEALSRGEDKGGGAMGLPHLAGGALAELAKMNQPSFSTVTGREAVDKMLSENDPSQRFRVYRRTMASSKGGSKRGSSGSFAHWLFISEDGKRGFGFNQDGEEVELPDSLEHYELHPGFKRSYTAAGLKKARQAREQAIAARYQYARENPWMFYDFGEMPDLHAYDGLRNNCQHYVDDIAKYYEE